MVNALLRGVARGQRGHCPPSEPILNFCPAPTKFIYLGAVACTGGGCGVAPPRDLGGAPPPPGVSLPPGHPRGGCRPPLNLFRGGEVLDDQYLSKICLKFLLAPCGRQFCYFLQDFRPPSGKISPPPEGGRKFFRGGAKK